eukprot:8096554-Alexandrium_andersonii.AAC.1
MLQRKFSCAVRQRMQDEGLLPLLPLRGHGIAPTDDDPASVAVTEDSFIDDVAIPLSASSGSLLLDALRRAVAVVEEIAAKYGLRLH